MKDQIGYLNTKYNQTVSEKNRTDQDTSAKLFEGMQVIDSLVKELDEMRQLNRIEEDHQVQLLQQLSSTCVDHDSKQSQLKQMQLQLQESESKNGHSSRDLEALQNQIRDNQQTSLRQSE